ncbi:MAG TPA: NAD(P)/FAD-dependent oxidoreductase [Acidimicrobiales bacterium]|nr:NAD(P)/FAD-dependent oxidoreductase [Acidimicrobiales bacterium]
MAVVPKVVVIGAGFGGVEVARDLKGLPVEVTLVDRHNYRTFQPLLYQVATAGLNAADVAHPVRNLFHGHRNVFFRQADVTGVDWDRRLVHLDGQPDLPFDHLVVAGGASVTWFGTPGAAEHGFPLYTLADAVTLRNHVIERFEAADVDPTAIDRGALTFVVVGGGPTGVETAGALAELFAMVFRKDYPRLDVSRARVVLVEMMDHLLGPFAESSQRHALDTLRTRGVEVRLGTKVAEVRADAVTFADGEVLPCQTLVWAAGVRANPLADALGVPQERGGRITVAPDLSIPGRPGAWAVGDIAAAKDRDGRPLPQLAPVAMQAGRHVARQIERTLEGRPTEPFRYRDKGTMATIGRRAAVAELPGRIRLRGAPAWVAWLVLHLVFLVGARNRASVLLNWSWSYLTWDRGPRIVLRPHTTPGPDGAAQARTERHPDAAPRRSADRPAT